MIILETIEKISKKYSESPSEFIKFGATLAMLEKKRNLQMERLEILAKYETTTLNELSEKIENGNVPEHPAWEDLIEIKNIDSEIKEIEDDIKVIQET